MNHASCRFESIPNDHLVETTGGLGPSPTKAGSVAAAFNWSNIHPYGPGYNQGRPLRWFVR